MSEKVIKAKINTIDATPFLRLPDLTDNQTGWWINGNFMSREQVEQNNQAFDEARKREMEEEYQRLGKLLGKND